MDINGTKFHLLYGRDDWGACVAIDDAAQRPLAELWALIDASEQPPLAWHPTGKYLHLARQAPLFVSSAETAPLSLDQRRGAGRDRYGHWYWIDAQQRGIRFLANGERTSVAFWSWANQPVACPPDSVRGQFTAAVPPTPERLVLRGLAVTTRHYLVVGNLTEHGLLIFDLHRGGPPLLVQWPASVPFAPWDMAPTPDGGVLILDRDNRHYWVLDQHFRLLADTAQEAALFQPAQATADTPVNSARRTIVPHGYALTSHPATEELRPISIESGPDGHVLVLYSATGQAAVIDEYHEGTLLARYSLQDAVTAIQPDLDEGQLLSISAHDFAYTACCAGAMPDCDPCLEITAAPPSTGGVYGEPRMLHLLYVARSDGNQVIAFEMNRAELKLDAQKDYLPLRRWEGKALVAVAGKVSYDFADRWVPLQIFVDCRYARRGTLTTPADFLPGNRGQQFDSGEPGCVWHRLLLDADIPPGTAIFVRARAADDYTLLGQTAWQPQPAPYLRSGGSELAFHHPAMADDGRRQGTWELLLQAIKGRYLQIELTLEGSGRSTPRLAALRVWYPRFSYLDHYLPVIYREDPVPAAFLERWLANFEGLYTNIEDKIEHLPRLLDPRTAPAETLAWLASWLGLALDPLWTEERRRFFIRHAYQLYSRRGTVPGVEIALRLYLDAEVGPWLFDLDCRDTTSVRIVERFLTRNVDPRVYGDPTTETQAGNPADSAHRFTVLLPHDLTDEQQQMARRIIDLEKPAHTAFELKRYWDLFRVGEARLGLDTRLGKTTLISPVIVGASALSAAYLQAPYPFAVPDRLISDRDRLGDLPEL